MELVIQEYEQFDFSEFLLEPRFSKEISKDVSSEEIENSGFNSLSRKQEIHPSLEQFNLVYTRMKEFFRKNGKLDQINFALYVAIMYNALSPEQASKLLTYVLYEKGLFSKGIFSDKKIDFLTEFGSFSKIFHQEGNQGNQQKEEQLDYENALEDEKEFVESVDDENALEGFMANENLKLTSVKPRKQAKVKYPKIDDEKFEKLLEAFSKITVVKNDDYKLFKTLMSDPKNFDKGSFSVIFEEFNATRRYPENPLDLMTIQKYFFEKDRSKEMASATSEIVDVRKQMLSQREKRENELKLKKDKEKLEKKIREEEIANAKKLQSEENETLKTRRGDRKVYNENDDYADLEDRYM